MRSHTLLSTTIAFSAAAAVALTVPAARRAPAMMRVDFGKTVTATAPAYDARIGPVADPAIKEFIIPITHDTIEIAKGVKYEGWTFGGTVPGPVIRVREGDVVRIKVVNKAPMPHSIDFHAARIPANVAYRMINPGDTVSFQFTASDPGAYMVHCGTPPVTMHIMQGMYFAIIVDPRDGWGTKADKEFVLVQSEFYAKKDSATGGSIPDWQAAMAKNASYVVFNGRAGQYKENPLKVDVGDRVRFFVVNAGPSFNSDFHVVGAVFDRVYPDANPDHVLEGVQTYMVPAGGGAVFETVFDKDASGEGLYPFVTHSFADAEKGAVGIIQVGTPKVFATMSH
ncbi:MAG TPA: multicopper oxidase domain-containing protein [Gemmatimonadaceae bacterium]|jgi:nitrite reductase (NO-forming)|nr:multicopper oxidase domain-containing protein [Gemmatimonadaceae bacterium]